MTANELKNLEEIKKALAFGDRCIAESDKWTENEIGGWKILATSYKTIAEELLQLVEELTKEE